MGADVERLTLDLEAETAEMARRIRATLTRTGHRWDAKDGHRVEVAFKGLQVVQTPTLGPVALLEVDTLRLPPRVRVDDLTSARTLHDLTAACGRRVEVLNTTGLTYAVRLQPGGRRRLPARVPLAEAGAAPPGPCQVPVGMGDGGPVWRSLAALDCVLVGGQRGMGKSSWVNTALAWLLSQNGPEALRLALVDPKEVELAAWDASPHALGPVARDATEAAALLGRALGELDVRRALFARAGVRNLEGYNAKAPAPLPLVLVVVDEVADLGLEGGPRSPALLTLQRLVAKGRAFGIHAILATQRPDAEAVAGLLKANVATRLAFWLPDDLNYRIVLDPPKGRAVPQLPRVPGRMIARLSGGTYQVLQGFHLGDDDLERIAAEVAAGRPVALDPGPLSGGHVEMVRWALAENGGRLTIANIQAYLALKPYPARMLAEEWAARGWLVKDGPAHLGRRVTGCLLELVERCEAGEWEPDAPGRFAGPVCGPQTGESADGPVCEGDL